MVEVIDYNGGTEVSDGGMIFRDMPVPRWFVETHREGEFVEIAYGRGGMRLGEKLALKASLILVCNCKKEAQWEVNVLG